MGVAGSRPGWAPDVIALDTNLLVYAHREGAREHAVAADLLRRVSRERNGWGFPLPVLAEFWRVVTHAAIPGGPSSPEQAAAFLQSLQLAGAHCWLPLAGFDQRFTAAALQLQARGVRIHDLQIALMACEGGARQLWTHDCDFVAVPGLELVWPLRN